MTALVLRDVEVEGRRADVRCAAGRVEVVAAAVEPQPGDVVVEGGGGALIPGLHDHHLHLLSAASAARSLLAGPPLVRTLDELAVALREADRTLPPGAWIRAFGYHESGAAHLDRTGLDRLVATRPVRLQHRSGALWILNTEGCRAVGVLDGGSSPHPMEVDGEGVVTGRLYRKDEWLRSRVPPDGPPDLESLGHRLARYGVTGVTDATPVEDASSLDLLARAPLRQRVQVMGGLALARAVFPPALTVGPVKVLLHDDDLPSSHDLVETFRSVHATGRPVAVHLVTRAALVLALLAWEEAGAAPGDRIEHGAVIPPALIGRIARLGLTVVTQPNFVAERGDEYLREVEPEDVADLYRCASLLERGVRVGAGSDAPFGSSDPWLGIAAAIDRRSRDGRLVGAGEAVSPERALGLYLAPLDDPGGPRRRVRAGRPADLVLLQSPLATALREPRAEVVRTTVIAGDLVAGPDG